MYLIVLIIYFIKSLCTSDSVMLNINIINDWCSQFNKFINTYYIYFIFNLFKVFSIDKVLLNLFVLISFKQVTKQNNFTKYIIIFLMHDLLIKFRYII